MISILEDEVAVGQWWKRGFEYNLKQKPIEQLLVNNDKVETPSSFKLLGIIISHNLSWDEHVIVYTYICSEASKRLCHSNDPVTTQTFWCLNFWPVMHIFSSVVLPICVFVCQVWHFSLAEKQSNQIEQTPKVSNKNHLIGSDVLRFEFRQTKVELKGGKNYVGNYGLIQ